MADQIPNDVLGRAVADSAFRSELLSDPAAANKTYDLGLNDEQIDALGKLDAGSIETSLAAGDTDLSSQ